MNDAIRSRRVVLRAALAAGCGVWVPIAVSGCDSKKNSASTGAATANVPAADAASSGPPTVKVAKTSVQYQNQPKGEQKCGNCLHFIAGSNTCKLVDGPISPEGWCSLWAAKA
jgi:High potential iron-sulfur protein